MSTGTNNGGGARWAHMERGECPDCGMKKPVGVYQQEKNGNRCLNKDKCRARAKRRARKAEQELIAAGFRKTRDGRWLAPMPKVDLSLFRPRTIAILRGE